MVQLLAFRRSLRFVALALSSVALAVVGLSGFSTVSPWRRATCSRLSRRHQARHYAHHRYGIIIAARDASLALGSWGGANAGAAASPTAMPAWRRTPAQRRRPRSFTSSNVVAEARRYLGGNPTGRGSLWCARFMNMVLQHSGYRGTGSDMANSFAHYGQRISGPQVGAIAVMGRPAAAAMSASSPASTRQGNPIMISGNNGNRVREAPISRGRISAYVMPAS